MKAIEIVILVFTPVIYALYNGRNGISHPAVMQVLWVTIIMMSCAIGISTYELHTAWPERIQSLKWVHIKCLAVSITGYGLFFPPLMNMVRVLRWDKGLYKTLGGKGHTDYKKFIIYCLDHLSPTAWPDRLFLKYNVHWITRLIMYAVLFLAAVLWFTWGSFRSLESYLH